MSNEEKIISAYFQSWVRRDFSKLANYFAPDICYRECYGPVYRNLRQLEAWTADSLKRQVVSAWDIKKIEPLGPNRYLVSWYFKASEQHTYDFDGVSTITFCQGKIVRISEYQSKHQTYQPYSD